MLRPGSLGLFAFSYWLRRGFFEFVITVCRNSKRNNTPSGVAGSADTVKAYSRFFSLIMSNRMIRDTTASEKINRLSPEAEVFFYRLMMRADDFGRFYGHPSLLIANLFPLRVESVTTKLIELWRDECVVAGVITTYTVDDKTYIHIPGFGQRLRKMVSKYPAPPIDSNPQTIDRNSPPEVEEEIEEEGKSKKKRKEFNPPSLNEVEEFFKEKKFPVELARRAFDYYSNSEPPWHDSKGNPVRSWKQKCIAVWMREENRTNGKNFVSHSATPQVVGPSGTGYGRL